jgi:uncharacterized protein
MRALLSALVSVAVAVAALSAQQPVADAPNPVRAAYTKYEHLVPMRDGVKLFTSVYVPKTCTAPQPMVMQRTPYSVAPYGIDNYRTNIGPSEHFQKEGFIFVYQDVRGRYMSEGDWVEVRPHNPQKRAQGRRREHRHLRHHRVAASRTCRATTGAWACGAFPIPASTCRRG